MDYDLTAESYDKTIGPLLKGIRKRVVDFVKYANPNNILEVASGTGEQAELIAKAGYKIKGIDLSEGMLKVANKRKHKNLEFLLGDAKKLPFKDNEFDVVITSFFLHETDPITRYKAIDEMIRVSKKYLIWVDYWIPKKSNITNKIFKYGIVFIERLAGKEHYNNYKDFMRNNALKGLIEKYNLKIEKISYHYSNNIAVVLLKK